MQTSRSLLDKGLATLFRPKVQTYVLVVQRVVQFPILRDFGIFDSLVEITNLLNSLLLMTITALPFRGTYVSSTLFIWLRTVFPSCGLYVNLL